MSDGGLGDEAGAGMWIGPEHEAEVVVPALLGLPVADAQRTAGMLGLKLATTDPDGPPLSALTWQRDCYITEQRPPAGFVMRRTGSLEVQYQEVPPGDDSGVREPRPPQLPLDVLAAHREPGEDDPTAGC